MHPRLKDPWLQPAGEDAGMGRDAPGASGRTSGGVDRAGCWSETSANQRGVSLLGRLRRIAMTIRAADTSGPYVLDHLTVLFSPDRLEVAQQRLPASETVTGEEGDDGDDESHRNMMAPR